MIFLFRCLHFGKPKRYFSTGLAVAVNDATAGEVVRAELDDNTVFGDDADVVLPHLSGDRCKHLVTVGQLNAEHRVGQSLGNCAFNLDDTVFFSHSLATNVQTGRSAWM